MTINMDNVNCKLPNLGIYITEKLICIENFINIGFFIDIISYNKAWQANNTIKKILLRININNLIRFNIISNHKNEFWFWY